MSHDQILLLKESGINKYDNLFMSSLECTYHRIYGQE